MAVDLTLAKTHLRVTHSSEDTTIASYLAAGIAWVENYTGKKLTVETVTEELSAFATYIPLSWGPSPSALVITYTDTDDVEQTIVDALIVKGRAYPVTSWPSISDNSTITLEYDAGFATVESDLDAAVLFLTAEFFAQREGGAVMDAVKSLCNPYRGLLG